eukprot:g1184.t1 g1184   contig10:1560096-1562284(-)
MASNGPMPGMGQVMVLNSKTQRTTGRQAQLGNISAARAVADIIRSTLGPRSMLKMLLDPMGGIVITNDGNCILREVDVSHPTAKSMIELSRAQDEEVGDGTTSVIILAGEMLINAEPFVRTNVHPTVIVRGYNYALQEALEICEKLALVVDVRDTDRMKSLVQSCIGTKFSSRWNDIMIDMALKAVLTVARATHTPTSLPSVHTDVYSQKMEVDIKRYAKVEKIPGGEISDCTVLSGVMFNKDVTHSKMRRRIENPRILLLDTPLEYKKGESQTNVEITDEEDWNTLLKMEEEYVENMCMEIIAFKPDIVITEKGVSDLAQHYFAKANITAFRRLRKTDNNRVARATGATIVSRTDEIREEDIGTGCGLFEMRKIGEEYFAFFEECKDPKACSIILRGGSKDVLNEIERNLTDAMQVVRNVVFDPRLLPGGGATEMAVSMGLRKAGLKLEGVQQGPFLAHGAAYEEIEKSGEEGAFPKCNWGIDGTTGELVDMEQFGIWEPFSVKIQTIKTAVESACMILRIDDIVSGSKKKGY